MSHESSMQVKAKRAMAERARRLANSVPEADRLRLLELAVEQEDEADALERSASGPRRDGTPS